jgi:hypothetical protein
MFPLQRRIVGGVIFCAVRVVNTRKYAISSCCGKPATERLRYGTSVVGNVSTVVVIIIIITTVVVIISEKTLGLCKTGIRMIHERTSRLTKHCAEHIAKTLLYLLNVPKKG